MNSLNSESSYIPISQLLAHGRLSKHPVAERGKQLLCWDDFSRAVSALAVELSARAEIKWCLYCKSSYAFSVALFALFHSNKLTMLPANGQEGTLKEMGADVDGVITDTDVSISGLPLLHPLNIQSEPDFVFKTLDYEASVLELYTSGSTGSRKRIPKSLGNLEHELTVLQGRWGKQLEGAILFSTVSHQHIYGLLYRVLWPLAAGRVFFDELISYPEVLVPLFERNETVCLISSPAHLKRIPELIELSRFSSKCKAVFSSGGLLYRDTALRMKDALGEAPIEVFGSTETGGIAWRQQCEGVEEECWSVLEGVSVRADNSSGILLAQSPFVSGLGEGEWFEGGDCIELCSDRKFLLRGRVDSIAKIEDKRVSLKEMEARLLEHDFIEEAVVIELKGAAPEREISQARVLLGAIAILTLEGKQFLNQHGRRKLSDELRHSLKAYFDLVVIPRKWRFIESFPEDSQGKRSFVVLKKLFSQEFSADVTMPLKIEGERSDSGTRLKLQVPQDLHYLNGHFPGQPIVPGFLQIDWVMKAIQGELGVRPEVKTIEVAKFHRVLRPGSEFELDLVWNHERRSVTFELHDGIRKYSSGRICYTIHE